MINRTEFISDVEWERFLDFSRGLETPCVVISLQTIENNYVTLRELFPYSQIYYAVKANPERAVVSTLAELGANFDLASREELDMILALNIDPARVSYGNTIKKLKDIAYFYEKGVRLFATDSEEDLKNIASAAPGSKVYVRIIVEDSSSADWPLSRKFGCHSDMAYDLLVAAWDLGLTPSGISFHVGSQQRDIGQWDDAIAKTKYLASTLEEEKGIHLDMVNMGGGFPAPYMQPANKLSEYAAEIHRYLTNAFGKDFPSIILEPGRSLTGNSGILISEVVLISRKSNAALNRWVYLDAGKFNGLIETLNEAIKYPIVTSRDSPFCKEAEAILAGPTCDSTDILYEDYKYKLPVDLAIGDRVYFLSTGAYTASYASVGFNGFAPLKTYIMP
ncbi:MAG: type III PLP-dependent enzyme [Treponema sp.]|jgi:ornithine decarboxylase|nr:type III PLP-dependent enzyme [Treponema sp.]